MPCVAGITFHDIRFRNERVIYELALQDAYASYSGTTPIQALSQYSDAGWGMGYSNFKLIPGVDCPAHATFLSTSHFVDGASNTNVNSVCVWEHPEEVAIMRHYDQDFAAGEGFMFATGAPKTVLVVRTTSTVYNYDCAGEGEVMPAFCCTLTRPLRRAQTTITISSTRTAPSR